MLPIPLHPAVVHFPVVLAMLLPLVALASLHAIRRGARPTVAWGITTVVAALLVVSAWVSLASGEEAEERAEDVVAERIIDSHAQAAELFTIIAGGVLLFAVAGLAKGKIGTGARIAASVGTLAVVGAGINVGHSGGQLVYRYGAAAAYATPSAMGATSKAETSAGGGEGIQSDDDDRP